MNLKKDKYKREEEKWSKLISSAQKGNNKDYHDFLVLVSNAVKSYLTHRFGQRDFINDCTQETLIAIHHALKKYNPEKKVRPWVFCIARNKAIDFLRLYQRSCSIISYYDEININEVKYNPGCYENILQGQLLNKLDKKHHDAIMLSKIYGYKINEISSILMISESAAKVRIHRGIKELRAHL